LGIFISVASLQKAAASCMLIFFFLSSGDGPWPRPATAIHHPLLLGCSPASPSLWHAEVCGAPRRLHLGRAWGKIELGQNCYSDIWILFGLGVMALDPNPPLFLLAPSPSLSRFI